MIWAAAIFAALGAALARGLAPITLLPLAGAAVLPSIIGASLSPFSRREWVQVLIIFGWLSLAIAVCLVAGFRAGGLLFLCAPAAAALFEKERVIEAAVMAGLSACAVYVLQHFGKVPSPFLQEAQAGWTALAGTMATIAFLLGSMFFGAARPPEIINAVKEEGLPPGVSERGDFAAAYPGAALEIGKDGTILHASHPAAHYFSLENAAGANLSDVFAKDEGARRNLAKAFDKAQQTGAPIATIIETVLRSGRGDKSGRAAQLEIKLVPQPGGHVFAFAEDRSEFAQKLTRLEAVQEAAAREAKQKTLFFAGVSHELRTPLNAIIGFSDMMRSRLFGPLPGKYAEYADLIHDSGQHMLDLIGDVLDMSKIEAGKYRLEYGMFDVADVVRSSMKMVQPAADAANLELSANVAANMDLIIEADRKALRQILLNLLSNSIKFTPKGGEVKVGAKIANGVVNISVEDNGMGVSARDLAKIGQPFTQAESARQVEARGSGLGLSLVKTLTELHKGRFVISSHPGAGTTVNIYLPVRRPAQ